MSWEEDAPRFTTLLRRSPVALKPHRCTGCDGAIQAGERYDLLIGICEDEGFQILRSHRRACYLDPSPADLARADAEAEAQAAADAEEEAWEVVYSDAEIAHNDDGVLW